MDKIIFATIVLMGLHSSAANKSTYKRAPDIKIGGQGGWDYITIDEEDERLFMSHAEKVDVVDLNTHKIIGMIPDTKGVHGIAIANDLKKGFTSNGQDNSVTVFELKTLTPISKISVGKNPDAILYVKDVAKVFVFNGKSKSMSVIDAKTLTVSASVELPGKPEFSVYDPELKAVFVNIEDKNLLVKIDAKSNKVLSQYPLKGCESPSGLAINKAKSELFSVCENNVMVMTSGRDGKILSTVHIGSGPDGVVFDANRNLAISANGEGTLTVAQVEKNSMKVISTVPSEVGARTIALNTKTQRLYLPTAQLEPLKKGEHRPRPVAGTYKLLVFEQE